jgi:8-oxo-dGTP pyrophosphatase MutT (NUDIX family)
MNLQVGVKVLLKNSEDKILILKRSEEKYGKTDGSWDIVGGRIDPGTSLLVNLRREVLEETKLTITSEPKLIAAQDIIRNTERHIIRLTYVALTTGEPQLDLVEHGEYKWVTFEELAEEADLDTYVVTLLKEGFLQADSWS